MLFFFLPKNRTNLQLNKQGLKYLETKMAKRESNERKKQGL